MSLRCLFVVSLVDSKLVFYKAFPTVEKRWKKEHPSYSDHTLPTGQKLLDLLLNELGILNPNLFQSSRDSCQKNLQAPLFWVPHDDSSSEYYWPVVVVECQSRLLCGVPYLDQQNPFGCQQSVSVDSSCDVVIALEVLSKLVHLVQQPISKMNAHLNKTIQLWFPFGRASGHQQLELVTKPAITQKSMWLRSKPKLEMQVKEEIRMIASSNSQTSAEVSGTIYFSTEAEVDCNGIKLELTFNKQSVLQPTALFHPSVLDHWGTTSTCNINIQQLLEKTFPMCHYSFILEEPPIQPVLKIRTSDQGKASIFIQLHANSAITKAILNRLEVRLPLPSGNRITRILTPTSHMLGLVSIIKDGAQLVWNLTPLFATTSSTKLKEDVTLNVDVEMDRFDASLINTKAHVFFASTGSTISGAQLTLLQPTEFKLVLTSEFKSSTYRAWNHGATEFA